VDKCKPGDRVSVTGVFRAKLNEARNNAMTKNFIIATGVQQINYEREKPNLTEMDLKNIKKLSKNEKLFDILGKSIASTIEGMDSVKKALLLQLLGGAEKNLENGTHLRGDVNILMVGDPSTAKS
jgi:DNA replication licensing factor MCM3